VVGSEETYSTLSFEMVLPPGWNGSGFFLALSNIENYVIAVLPVTLLEITGFTCCLWSVVSSLPLTTSV
jgi:hypothetical protein